MPANWKTVRVFISSTFRDMQAERDHLVRFVFPRLREQLLPRRIHLVDVDLRWGVTSEQDASEICREIITECRPRFLCMLGGRYGTIPEGKELSITADEVHFGVFDAHRERLYGLFYFRHGAVTERMDKSSPGAIREPRDSEKAGKLARLKRLIRRAKCKPVLYRPHWNAGEQRLVDLKAFGDRIERDILATIDEEFGPEPPAQIDEFAEENAAMDAFVEEHSQRFVLGSRSAVLEQLLAHASATGGNGYVCVTGAPGSGKSALLAHVSQQLILASQSSILVIRHFVGASPGSTDVRRTLRRLCHELKAGCPEITDDIPDDPEKLRVAFPNFLRRATVRKRVVILIDAVNQFDPTSHSAGPHWLPQQLPEGACIILSALDSPVLEELRGRLKPRQIELQPLTAADSEAIVERFRKRYRKMFEPDQRAALLAKTDAGTPLYLLAALEELRTLGTYEEISDRIAELPPTTHELFAWILKRLENDDGFRDAAGRRVGQGLVSRFAALLGVSRHGLSQHELADLLDPGDPQGNVATLLHLLRPYLMRRGGLLDLYHGQLREAVRIRFMPTPEHEKVHRLRFADYFGQVEEPTCRALDEVPWQLQRTQEWGRLRDCLSGIAMFVALYRRDEYEVLHYWLAIGDRFDMAASYNRTLATWTAQRPTDRLLATTLNAVAEFLRTAGRLRAAEPLYRQALSIRERILGATDAELAQSINNLAELLKLKGQYREAAELYRRARPIWEAALGPESVEIATNADNLALALHRTGDYRPAEALYREALRLRRKIYGAVHPHVAFSLNNLGVFLMESGRHVEAAEPLTDALRIWRETLGSARPEVATALHNLAGLSLAAGDVEQAEQRFREALAIRERTFGRESAEVAESLTGLASIAERRADYAQAEELYRRGLTIRERVFGKGHWLVASSLHELSALLSQLGRSQEAEEYCRQSLAICGEVFGEESAFYASGLNMLGEIRKERKDLRGAESLHRKALAIRRALDQEPQLAESLNNLAGVLYQLNEYPESEQLYRRALAMLDSMPTPPPLRIADTCSNLGVLLRLRGEFGQAEQLQRRALALREGILGRDHPRVAHSLNNLARLRSAQGDRGEALKLYQRAFQILSSKLGWQHPETQRVLTNLAALER